MNTILRAVVTIVVTSAPTSAAAADGWEEVQDMFCGFPPFMSNDSNCTEDPISVSTSVVLPDQYQGKVDNFTQLWATSVCFLGYDDTSKEQAAKATRPGDNGSGLCFLADSSECEDKCDNITRLNQLKNGSISDDCQGFVEFISPHHTKSLVNSPNGCMFVKDVTCDMRFQTSNTSINCHRRVPTNVTNQTSAPTRAPTSAPITSAPTSAPASAPTSAPTSAPITSASSGFSDGAIVGTAAGLLLLVVVLIGFYVSHRKTVAGNPHSEVVELLPQSEEKLTFTHFKPF